MSKVSETKYKIITENVNKGGQYVLFTRLFEMGDKKLKIEIKSDAYNCQCYANIKVFSPEKLQWNDLHSIHYSAMATPPNLGYRSPTVDSFKIDTDLLTKYAEEILN